MYHFIPINDLLYRWAISSPCYLPAFFSAHLFLGSFPAFVYLRPVTVIFCLWAKFSPWLQSARLWSVNTLGHFHSIIKYGLLTMARLWTISLLGHFHGGPAHGKPVYGHNAVCLAHVWPIDHTVRIRPIDDTTRRRPIVSMARRRPIVSMARRRPTISTANRRPSVTTVNISPWLLWPSFKK